MGGRGLITIHPEPEYNEKNREKFQCWVATVWCGKGFISSEFIRNKDTGKLVYSTSPEDAITTGHSIAEDMGYSRVKVKKFKTYEKFILWEIVTGRR